MKKLRFRTGSIMKSDARVLVNPVNTKGVMGAGLAASFKKNFPENFNNYSEYCKSLSYFSNYLQFPSIFYCSCQASLLLILARPCSNAVNT